MARSGLQSEVINLYRAFLRIAMQRKVCPINDHTHV